MERWYKIILLNFKKVEPNVVPAKNSLNQVRTKVKNGVWSGLGHGFERVEWINTD